MVREADAEEGSSGLGSGVGGAGRDGGCSKEARTREAARCVEVSYDRLVRERRVGRTAFGPAPGQQRQPDDALVDQDGELFAPPDKLAHRLDDLPLHEALPPLRDQRREVVRVRRGARREGEERAGDVDEDAGAF